MTSVSCFIPFTIVSPFHNVSNRNSNDVNKSCFHKKSSLSACLTASTRAPVLILPGLGNASSDYDSLVQQLQMSRGHVAVETVPVRRWDWARNARGFFSRNYWSSTLTPSPILDWYFDRTHAALQKLAAEFPGRGISILGHSAGVTLGTPHNPPPTGALDQTRGLLTYVATNCVNTVVPSGTFVSVAGTGTIGKRVGRNQGSWNEWLAYLSYAAVCGDGHVDGDGVTPVIAAEAPNAKVVYCPCSHSMLTNASNWYGSPHILPHWADYLL